MPKKSPAVNSEKKGSVSKTAKPGGKEEKMVVCATIVVP